jgi:presenilin-like A22 family membrane protease
LRKVIGTKGILEVIAVFAIVLFSGVFIASEAVKTSTVSIMYSTLENPMFIQFSYLLDATIVLTVLLIAVRRHRHFSNTVPFEALEAMVTSFTSFFTFLLVLAILMPHELGNGSIYLYAAALALALVLLKDEHHRLRDLTTVISSIGVGLVLGLNFPFSYAIAILAVVAVYDYISVFRSNEMVTLAKAASDCDLSFLISVSDLEAVPETGMSKKDIAAYVDYLCKEHDLDDPRFAKILEKGKLPVMSQVSLGEGDLSLPLMAVISGCLTFGSVFGGVVLAGAIAGIILTMLILKLYKRPIPAIPPLFACIGLFSGAALVLTHATSLYDLGASILVVSVVAMLVDITTIANRMRPKKMGRDV